MPANIKCFSTGISIWLLHSLEDNVWEVSEAGKACWNDIAVVTSDEAREGGTEPEVE